MLRSIRKPAAAVVALGALGLGGAAIADATTSSGKTSGSGPAGAQARPSRDELAGDAAAKVKAAALAKVPGATVLRTEAGGPYNAAYHAHIRTADGAQKVVLVNASFQATSVVADQGRPGGRGHGGRGPGGPGGRETPLTGDTKSQVEAAVLAKYPGATVVRTETNADSAAPYESHIKTSDGQQLEVRVSKDFKVLDAREHPAHP